MSGKLDEAEADAKKALELSLDVWARPFPVEPNLCDAGAASGCWLRSSKNDYEPLCLLQHVITYYALGRERESDAALSALIAKYGYAYHVATVYAFRNQLEEAFEWLDRAYAQRDSSLIGTKVDPLLKSLHNDPRYAALLKKLNLPN